MFDAIIDFITSASKEAKILVIYLDEFHLFFVNEHGEFDNKNINGFLKLFTELKRRQTDPNTGTYIICSTNKVNLIPVELLDNPDRISKVIRIDFPTYEERISVINNYLDKHHIPKDLIDVEYIASIISPRLSQGKVIEVVKAGISKASIDKKILDTNSLYYAVNLIDRRIHADLRGLNENILNSLSKFNSMKVFFSLGISSKEFNIFNHFDMATIYPIKKKIDPKPVKSMYERPNLDCLSYGSIFYKSKGLILNNYSLEEIVKNTYTLLSAKSYCKKNNIPLMKDVLEEVKDLFKETYEYYELENPNIEINLNYEDKKYDNPEVSRKVKAFVDFCDKEIEELINDEVVELNINRISNLLKKNKILTNDLIYKNKNIILDIDRFREKLLISFNKAFDFLKK